MVLEKPASLPPMVRLTSVVLALQRGYLAADHVGGRRASAQATETNEAGECAAAHCSG